MHIISLRKLKEFWRQHPDAESLLRRWYKITKKSKWQSLADNPNYFPHADLAGVCTIFNIKGNSYRLVTKIYYDSQLVLTRFVMTHAEYDKGEWTDDCEC